jgi:hypothetical protein
MHWSMIVWLMYLWRSRTYSYMYNSSPLKPSCAKPLCAKCRFFLPPTDDLNRVSNVRMGKCLLYPYSNQTVATLVVGMATPDYGGLFQYAGVARSTETMCGPSGTQFSAKHLPRYIYSQHRAK